MRREASSVVPHCVSCHRASIIRRGVCHACYERYSALVRRQQLTWEQLEAAGLALPPKYRTAAWRAWWAAAARGTR